MTVVKVVGVVFEARRSISSRIACRGVGVPGMTMASAFGSRVRG